MNLDSINNALDQLINYGLELTHLSTDGKIVRCKHIRDKGGKKNGWYVAHEFNASSGQRFVVGAYGWWKGSDHTQKIKITDQGSFSESDRQEIEEKQKQINLEVEQERQRAADAAEDKAGSFWESASPGGDSIYLKNKGVKPYGVKFSGDLMLVPASRDGRMVGIQTIGPDGKKLFTKGMAKKGAFHFIGKSTQGQPVAVAEGYATAATIHELTGWPVAVAFDCGNLLPVARELILDNPDVKLIFCGDNDEQTEGNPGATAAREAAKATNGIVVLPKFSNDIPGTDFNDLAQIDAQEARKQLLEAVPLTRQGILDAFTKCTKKTDALRLLLGNVGNQLKGMPENDWNEMRLDLIDTGHLKGRELDKLRKSAANNSLTDTGWQRRLKLSETGKILPARGNLLDIMAHDPALKNALAFDIFTQKVKVLKKLPGMKQDVPEDGIFINDDIHSCLLVYLSRNYCDFRKEYLHDVIITIAYHHSFNPLVEKLESCAAAWDGVKRIDTWLHDLCEAENSEYTRTVGKLWLVQAISRAFQPGCKADCMLILEGLQGAKKSSFFDFLSFGYFTDRIEDISGKDGISGLLGKWIVEFSELDALRGKRAEAIKSYLGRRIDNGRLAFRREDGQYPRTCVIVGTTNEEKYLGDFTGNRRYWPVKCGKFKSSEIEDIREQLWGEAVLSYQENPKWWIDEDEPIAELFRLEQNERLQTDDRESSILRYLKDADEDRLITSTELWENALEGRRAQFERKDQMMLANIMRNVHGWEKSRARLNGLMVRGWIRSNP